MARFAGSDSRFGEIHIRFLGDRLESQIKCPQRNPAQHRQCEDIRIIPLNFAPSKSSRFHHLAGFKKTDDVEVWHGPTQGGESACRHSFHIGIKHEVKELGLLIDITEFCR